MAILAKYLVHPGSPDTFIARAQAVVGPLERTGHILSSYPNMDSYWNFTCRGVVGQLMLTHGRDETKVLAFTMPNLFQRSKARRILEELTTIQTIDSRPFPGGKSSVLTFV